MFFLYYVPNNQARVKSASLPSVCELWESHQFDGNVGRLEVVTDMPSRLPYYPSACRKRHPYSPYQRPSYHFDSSAAHSLNSWIRKHRR